MLHRLSEQAPTSCPSTSEASLDPRSSRMDAFPEPAGVVDVAVARSPGGQSELEQALELRQRTGVRERRHAKRHYTLWPVLSTGEA